MSPASKAQRDEELAPLVAPGVGARTDAAPATNRGKLAAALHIARGVSGDGVEDWTPYERALAALLDALDWSGAAEQLVEALPHVDPIDSVEALEVVLARLGIDASIMRRRSHAATPELFPAVYPTKVGPCVARDLADYEARDKRYDLRRRGPWLCTVKIGYAEAKKFATRPPKFFDYFLNVARGDLVGAVTLTALINLFVLAVPLFAIGAYNLALPANAGSSLLFFTLLALAALVAEDRLRRVRGELIAGMAARLHARIMIDGVRKRLATPLATLERISTAAVLAQFKRMENLLGFFQSGNARTLIDAPFVVIFLLFLGVIGGWIVVAPLVAIAALLLLAALQPALSRTDSTGVETSRWQTRELVRETVTNAAAIREAGAEDAWLTRLSQRLDHDAGNAAEGEETSETSTLIGQAILGVASAATLGLGAYLVMEGGLSVGALMAATILNMRILGPVNAFAQSMGQLRALREDVGLIEQMLALDDEPSAATPSLRRRFHGDLRLNRVGLRLPEAADFALRNISLQLQPGDRLAVVGPNGSGRSLLLRVAVGLTSPTLGLVSLDGLPLSQLADDERRRVFGYAPVRPDFLYGTVAQNMRFARMDAGDFEMEELLEAIGLPLDRENFPDGLQTRLTEVRRQQLGVIALQKLNIARAILSRRPVLAFDNVFSDLDPPSRAAVLARLDQSRDEQSVILVGAHRDVIEACETTLAMKQGAIAAFGPTDEVLPTITKS